MRRLPRTVKLLVDAGAQWLTLTAPEVDLMSQQRAPRMGSALLTLARLCEV